MDGHKGEGQQVAPIFLGLGDIFIPAFVKDDAPPEMEEIGKQVRNALPDAEKAGEDRAPEAPEKNPFSGRSQDAGKLAVIRSPAPTPVAATTKPRMIFDNQESDLLRDSLDKEIGPISLRSTFRYVAHPLIPLIL